MKDTKETWIQAAIKLGNDPNEQFPCPECGGANLDVKDVEVGDIVERHLICPICGKYNAMRMSKPVKTKAKNYEKL